MCECWKIYWPSQWWAWRWWEEVGRDRECWRKLRRQDWRLLWQMQALCWPIWWGAGQFGWCNTLAMQEQAENLQSWELVPTGQECYIKIFSKLQFEFILPFSFLSMFKSWCLLGCMTKEVGYFSLDFLSIQWKGWPRPGCTVLVVKEGSLKI